MSRGPIPDKPINRPKVPQIVKRCEAYYRLPGNSVGGSLHAVLDDGNIDDGSIKYAIWVAEQRFPKIDKEGIEIARLLLDMTTTQRRNVMCRIRPFGKL